jgi:hypothetical protein
MVLCGHEPLLRGFSLFPDQSREIPPFVRSRPLFDGLMVSLMSNGLFLLSGWFEKGLGVSCA